MSEKQKISMSENQVQIDRRQATKIIAGTIAGVALGAGSSPENSTAQQTAVPDEAKEYMSGNVELGDIAREHGKIITLTGGGRGLRSFPQYRRAVTQANGMLASADMLWNNLDSPENSLHPDVTNLENTDWTGIDEFISIAHYEKVDRMAFEPLIFADMGFGQSTTGYQRIPDSLLHGNYTYDETINIQNQSIDLFFNHLIEQNVIGPEATVQDIRVGTYNEVINNNVDNSGALILDVNNPDTWYKGADFFTSKRLEAGEPLDNGVPRHMVEGFRKAGKYALEYDVPLGVGEYWAETSTDYMWGGQNQKAEALYNFIVTLKDHPDPTIQELFNKSLIYIALQNHHDAQTVLNAGIDSYAHDIQTTTQRYAELGIPVVFSELTVSQRNLYGTIEQNEGYQADITNAIALAGYNAGVKEIVAYTASDIISPQDKAGIFTERYQKKPNYAALAAAAEGKRIIFSPGK